MNNREKQILKILRHNPLLQQNEIADILQISRSRVAAHIMDLMRKGAIKGKGYILTDQTYCVVVGAINMDIRGVADIHYLQKSSSPGSIYCSAGGVGRNIAHNLALLGRDVHLISAVGNDFYGEMLLEQTRQAGVNISSCIRLHGQNTSTYLSIANQLEETVMAINDTHILQQLTPQHLDASRMLIRHAGVVLADCNLTTDALEWVFTVADEIPVFIDTVSVSKVAKVKNCLPRIHTLKPTQKELEILWGSPVSSDADRLNAVNSLHQQGVQQIFVWQEDESVFCSERDGEQFLLTPPVHTVVDSFGADDGFMAGLIYSFLEGSDFRESANFAMACAALSRASISINNPTLSVVNAQYLLQKSRA
ncbi:sugar kinase [Salmonella enterica]|nr:sugar kinase [Salmonella enterica]EEJ3970781.1 sugar kinase [Salmonella enterica subsp. enterica serovar Gatuni]EHC5873964.1 sugar kinase [Salmonella enterica subsp. enterica serovar Eastbourne]EBM4432283.1 sugar kinase [Salmonella enterica]EDU8855695.1 sugar kinase [Salmonella enterica]